MAGIRTTSPQRGASRSLDHMRHYDRTCLSTHLPEASAKKHRSIRAQKHNDPAAPYREAGSYVQASKGTLRPLSALPSWLREAPPCRRPSQQLQRRLWMHPRLPIGSAPCRERVFPYVFVFVVSVFFKKNILL